MKYIGTNKQLEMLGFRLINDYEIKAIRINVNRSSNTFISNDNEIICWNKKDIMDLIDLSLVEDLEQ